MRPRTARKALAGAVATALAVTTAVLAPAVPASAAVPFDEVPAAGWGVDGRVLAVEIVGKRVYVGGTFEAAVGPRGQRVERRNLAAFSMRTGRLVKSWRPHAGARVTAIASDGDALFVGGDFGQVGGVERRRLAKLDLGDGDVDPRFRGRANGVVRALEVSGDSLYVGGSFGKVGGANRRRLAAVDTTTGAVDRAFRARADQSVNALAVHPRRRVLFVAGEFERLSGVPRHGVGAVDRRDGDAAGPAFAGSVRPTLALAVNRTGTRLFGAGGTGVNPMSAWRTRRGSEVWRLITDGDNQATIFHRGTVYVGFHDGYQGDQRLKLLAVDPGTGHVDPGFRPAITGFWGVFAIDASKRGLVVGGEFSRVSGVPVSNLARFRRRVRRRR